MTLLSVIILCISHLEGIVKAAVRASSSISGHLKPRLNFKRNAAPITTSHQRSEATLLDAFYLAGDSVPTSKTIAVCVEYQTENTPDCVEDVTHTTWNQVLNGLTAVVQNIAKITGSMANCIRQKSRRRFVFGFTIGNIYMRLWYCDRGSIVTSQSFNFITVRRAIVPLQHMF